MMDNWANIFPIGLILAATLVIFTGASWRNNLIALAVLFFGSFFLYMQQWDFLMAAVKLITGWMCVAVLSFVTGLQDSSEDREYTPKRIFMVVGLLLVWVLAALLSTRISSVFDMSPEIAFASFSILGSGLLLLGFKSAPFKVILGILTFFAGFELLYAELESSILIIGLMAAVNLLIAFVGSYLVTISKPGGTE
jgi:hypothetical protein